MNNILKFSVENIELIDNINKSLFRKVRIKAFATGENAHTLPIEKDVLERGAKTIYNKPILWKYNRFIDDMMGHEKDEVPCGFVPESLDNPIRFEESNGKTFIVIDALLWTRYCGRLIKIFERDGMKKGVSVELATIDEKNEFSNKPKVKDFIIAGITLLGEYVNPACKGCESELLEFSEDKIKYLDQLNFAENLIIIDNTKESSVNGEWSNPRRKLFNPIINSNNKPALLKEAYLVGDSNTKDPEITKFKYPHHVIRDNKLVMHQRGIQAAFQRASQQGIVSGDVKSHLLRHYRELGLNTENFSDFNISKNEFDLYFADELNKNESVGESGMTDNLENKAKMAEEDKPKEQEMAGIKKEMCNDDLGLVNNADEDINKNLIDDDDDDDKDMSIEKAKVKMSKMAEKIKKLEADNSAYMAKVAAMSDYEDLKNFKKMAEEQKVKEQEMAAMEKVMADIENRGINMSKDDRQSLMDKISEFTSVDAWTNFAKAQVFDRVQNTDGISRIGMPFVNTKSNSGSIWERI